MSTPHRISRRTFLRGAGFTLALPLLEAMIPSRAQAATAPPRRMICINTSLGLHTPNLFPGKAAKDYALTPYLEAIRDFRNEFTIFSGLSHPEVDGGHPTERCYLTAVPRPRADNFKNSISLDQFAVEKLVPDTRFSSLALSSNSSRGLSFTRGGVPIPPGGKAVACFQEHVCGRQGERGRRAGAAAQAGREHHGRGEWGGEGLPARSREK